MFLVDHGIWVDSTAWNNCIETVLNFKMNEANVKMKRRAENAQKLAEEKKK